MGKWAVCAHFFYILFVKSLPEPVEILPDLFILEPTPACLAEDSD